MLIAQTTETFQNENQEWLGTAHGTDMCRSITLDTSMFTAGTHYPNGYFPSGLPLGVITGTGQGGVVGLFGPYSDAATDGRQTLVGFLLCSQDAPSVTTVDVPASIYEHGRVVESKLPIAIDAAGRTDCAGRITFV